MEINESELVLNKVKLISQSKWDTISPFQFEKILTFRLLQEGKGSIALKRICPIRTSEGKAEVIIVKRDFKATVEATKELIRKIAIGQEVNFDDFLLTLEEFILRFEKEKRKDEKLKSLYEATKKMYDNLLAVKRIAEELK